jgi:Ni,Fe-hydrogenase III small subunit
MKSIFIFGLHLGGSNGAALELNAIFTPPYNAAKYGISLVHSPRRADVVLVTGTLTPKMAAPAYEMFKDLPQHAKIILLGSDATSGAPYAGVYGAFGPVVSATEGENEAEATEQGQKSAEGLVLPPGRTIAAKVAGSPPDPLTIINAILAVA